MPTIQSKAAAFVASRQMTYQKTGMQLQKRLLCSEHSVFRPKDSPLREKEKCALLASCQKRERLRINTKWESKEKKVNKGPALSVFRMGPDSSRNNTETQKGKRSHKRNEEGQKGARNGNKVLQVGSPFMACKNVFCQPLPCYSMTTTFMFTWAQQPFFFLISASRLLVRNIDEKRCGTLLWSDASRRGTKIPRAREAAPNTHPSLGFIRTQNSATHNHHHHRCPRASINGFVQ